MPVFSSFDSIGFFRLRTLKDRFTAFDSDKISFNVEEPVDQ